MHGLYCPLTRDWIPGAETVLSLEVRVSDGVILSTAMVQAGDTLTRPRGSAERGALHDCSSTAGRHLLQQAASTVAMLSRGLPVPSLAPGWNQSSAKLAVRLSKDATLIGTMDRGGTYTRAFLTLAAGDGVEGRPVLPPLEHDSGPSLKLAILWPRVGDVPAGGVTVHEFSQSSPSADRAVVNSWREDTGKLYNGAYFRVGQQGFYEEFQRRAREGMELLPPKGLDSLDREQLYKEMNGHAKSYIVEAGAYNGPYPKEEMAAMCEIQALSAKKLEDLYFAA